MAFNSICSPEAISSIVAGCLTIVGALAQIGKKYYRKGLSGKQVVLQMGKEEQDTIKTVVHDAFTKKDEKENSSSYSKSESSSR